MQKSNSKKSSKTKKDDKEVNDIINSLIGYDSSSSLNANQKTKENNTLNPKLESFFKNLSTTEVKNNLNLISEKFLPGHSLNIRVKNNDIYLMHWNGRFGNRMHTYAYMHNRAKKFNANVYLPSDWEGSILFNLDYKIIEDDEYRTLINQSIQPFDSFEGRMKATEEYGNRTGNVLKYLNPDEPENTYKKFDTPVVIDSLAAYHNEIFKHMKLSDMLETFQFSDKVKNLDLYKKLEDKQGTYDIAHLRRDDVSNVDNKTNGGYSVVSKKSYTKAFKKFGYDPDKIEWVSDDWYDLDGVGTCLTKGYVPRRGNWTYPVGSEVMPEILFDWLPDFLRIYFARTIFRANSSFSFWASTLARGRDNPPKIFAPILSKRILTWEDKTKGQQIDCDFAQGNYPHWMCLKEDKHCNYCFFEDEDPSILEY